MVAVAAILLASNSHGRTMATMMAGAVLEPRVSGSSTDERPERFDRETLAHLDALYGFAYKLTRVREEAEDLVSDTLLRAYERWRQFQPSCDSMASCS